MKKLLFVLPWLFIRNGNYCDVTYNGKPDFKTIGENCDKLEIVTKLRNISFVIGEMSEKTDDEKKDDLLAAMQLGLKGSDL